MPRIRKRRIRVSKAEVWVPDAIVELTAQVSMIFFAVPTIATDGKISWSEIEVPDES